MIEAVLNERCERYKEAAIAAFILKDEIDAYDCGGITPERIFKQGKIVKCGKEVKIAIDYTYPKTCGLSDVTYHVKGAGETFTDVYTFRDGKADLNGGPLFEKPWSEESKKRQNSFFDVFSDILVA